MPVHYLHTMIRVRDLDAAIAFYTSALGYVLRARREGPEGSEIAFLRLEGEVTELQLSRQPGAPTDPAPPRIMHLAYRVDDLAATLDAVVAAGATVRTGPYTLPSGSIVAFVVDPDGYDLELVQKPVS